MEKNYIVRSFSFYALHRIFLLRSQVKDDDYVGHAAYRGKIEMHTKLKLGSNIRDLDVDGSYYSKRS
jgi:hypothetical protein